MIARIFAGCSVLWLAGPAHGQAHPPPAGKPRLHEPVPDETRIEKFPYQRYHTTDSLGRVITFYLSTPKGAAPPGAGSNPPSATRSSAPTPPSATNASWTPPTAPGDLPLPLVLCVQGSGSQSVFVETDTPQGKRIGSGGPEAVVLKEFRDRVRVLVVEKPGVEFLVQPTHPGGAEESSEEFRREFTLDRWVEALNAAVSAASTIPGIDSRTVLALGHSEGGQVVCHLAAKNPQITHVAALAGGGPTQLFDLLTFARRGSLGTPGNTEHERVQWLLDAWSRVIKNPDATDEYFLGHPHRRWSSFLASSPAVALLSSNAKVFLAQGTADTNTLPESTDALYAELLAHGRSVTYARVEGGDHGFMINADPDGWIATMRQGVEWFLSGGGAQGAE